ncbi:MAG: LacI family DNA-binding transcriptional regulator [Pseudomonadota bacterium]
MTRKVGRIRDVATETGLSTATISRVMNGAENVSPKTRARVLEACQRLDYFPNPAAKALSTAKSKTIAAIIPTIEHSIYAKYIAAIEQTLAKRGYSIVLAISNADEESELEAAHKLLGMGAQAFILSGAAHRPELSDMFIRRGVPFVFTSVWNAVNSAPTIGYDNFEFASRAVTYLSEKGHSQIAVLHGPLSESDRTRARCDGARSAGSEGICLRFFETTLDVTGGRSAINRVLQERRDITAVLCFSDVLALGVYFGLSSEGLTVPGDISVMGFDNLDWSAAVVPGLTTIDLPAGQMGEHVAAQLVAHLETGTPIMPTKLDASIVERGSVKTIRPG